MTEKPAIKPVVWRPLHHGLHMEYPKAAVVHLMLVDSSNEKTVIVPCGRNLGTLITGRKGQVNCPECHVEASKMTVDWFG